MKIICILLILLGFNSNLFFDNIRVNIYSVQNRDTFRLNCDSLINVYKDYSIRSILPDSLSSIYQRPSIKGQFVRYILISRSMIYDGPTGDIVGSLVVYETKNCKRGNLFVEFISNTFPTISVHDNQLKVGSSIDDLMRVLGAPSKIEGNTYLYKNISNNLASIYSIKNEKIADFRIGKYNSKMINSIEDNLDLLLNHFP